MKRLILLTLVLTCIISCKDDDDFTIFCETPNNLNVTDITHISVMLNWANANEVKAVNIEYGLSGFQIGTGTVISTTETAIALNGLTPNTAYDYYIIANCDVDNVSMISNVNTFTTDVNPIIAAFLPSLSQLNIFIGDLEDLNISSRSFKYELNTSLFTDYAHKLRIIALPDSEALEYDGNGFPLFPNGTLMAKTFYYNLDETDLSAGKKIIETRILIKENDAWTLGNYKWNDAQTDATLDTDSHIVNVDWINSEGNNMSAAYRIPSADDCTKCHSNAGNTTPIGTKLRTMNFEIDGVNQLQKFIDAGHLINAPDPNTIASLPNWEDTNHTLEERSRAYFDINCAHCHSPGGFCDAQSTLDLRYETAFGDTNIFNRKGSISFRMGTYTLGFSMPFIGTTMIHTEGYNLIQEFLDTL